MLFVTIRAIIPIHAIYKSSYHEPRFHVSQAAANKRCVVADFFSSTGASGYIGGDVLYGLTKSNLASRIVALVRSETTAARIVSKHPAVTPLIGDLDAAGSIQDAVSQADVILRK